MLIDTPQITWHGGEAGKNAPILSLDIHPLSVARARGLNAFGTEGSSFVLATAGTDAEVRLWIVGQPLDKEEEQWEEPEVLGRSQSFVTSLGGHEQGVNVVRFSPDGLGLASASDGGTVVIWSVGEIGAWSTLATDRDTQKTILRGATEDIYDLTWSPDSKYIACGSIDRRAHVWEVATKRSIATLEDHANYVQGTAWDPLSKYLATQSSDRSCRVYQLGQSGQSGSDGTCGGSGRLTVKCCNVIKSCVVTPEDGHHAEDIRYGAPSIVGAEATCSPSVYPTEIPRSLSEGSKAVEHTADTNGDRDDNARAIVAALVDQENLGLVTGGRASSRERLGTVDVASEEADHKDENGDEKTVHVGAEISKDKVKPVQRRNFFVDETVTSFFRRLTWTPDGAFLITPTAQNWDPAARQSQFCTYLFTRGQFVKPGVCLPGLTKPSVAVRCNPRLFALKGDEDSGDGTNEAAVSDLPYRVIFAVVSLDAVVVYDTEHSHPLTVASRLHYSGLTDACWSADGLSLFVSSTDGYISTFHFKPGELGIIIPNVDVPLQTQRLHPVIYGWRPEMDGKHVSAVPSSSPRSPDTETARQSCETPTPMKPRVSNLPEHEQPITRRPDAASSKPKKKIMPTLLTPLVHGAKLDMTSFTAAAASGVVIAQTYKGVVQGDRKKRRIAPTLVRNDVIDVEMPCDDAEVSSAGRVELEQCGSISPLGNGLIPSSTCTGAPPAGIGQDDRLPKRKRLTPTLVSAL